MATIYNRVQKSEEINDDIKTDLHTILQDSVDIDEFGYQVLEVKSDYVHIKFPNGKSIQCHYKFITDWFDKL